MTASIDRLQLLACFVEVDSVLVDVFWAIVHLRPPGSHRDQLDAFARVNRKDYPGGSRQTAKIA